MPMIGTHQEVITKLIFVIEETFEQFNTDDVPGIHGANIGLEIKLKFHVSSYVRIQTLHLFICVIQQELLYAKS